MSRHREFAFVSVLLTVGGTLAPPAVAQPAKAVDHPVPRQPKYTASRQVFCRLAFAAKRERNVWLAIDGDRLYLDRNADRDLTDTGERFEGGKTRDVTTEFTANDLRRRYSKLRVRWANSEKRKLLIVSVAVGGAFRMQTIQDADSLATKPERAPVVRFGGELQLQFYGKPSHSLWRGKNARTILPIFVGIEARSKSPAKASVVSGIPRDVRPVAQIRYLSKNSKDNPITVTVPLNSRDPSGYFSATATAPANARPGAVEITVSLKGWDAARVRSATLKTTLPKFADLPVIDPSPKRPGN